MLIIGATNRSVFAMDLDFFGPKNFEECRQKYALDSNKIKEAKVAIAFACYAKFNSDPNYLSHLPADEKEALLKSASCLLGKRDDIYSVDSALRASTVCADKYGSRLFVIAVNSAMFPKHLDD